MRKSVITALFTVAAFSQAVFANDDAPVIYEEESPVIYEEEAPVYYEDEIPAQNADSPLFHRNSFFYQVSTGFLAHTYEGKYRDYYYSDDSEDVTVSEKAFSISGNFGINFARLFTLYLGTNWNFGGGSLSADSTYEDVDADYWGFDFHLGATIFPFRRDPGIDGLFAGVEFGIGISEASFDDYRYNDDQISEAELLMRIKAGYLWNISERVGLGFECYFNFIAYPDDDYWEGYYDLSGSSFGVNLTIVRR